MVKIITLPCAKHHIFFHLLKLIHIDNIKDLWVLYHFVYEEVLSSLNYTIHTVIYPFYSLDYFCQDPTLCDINNTI